MKVKTSELTGPALDWVVATLEKHQWRCPWILQKDGLTAWLRYEEAWGNRHPSYSTDWSQGGPIIEREKLNIEHFVSIQFPAPAGGWCCNATWESSTPLIAAMRCFVASKLGDEVGVPEELL